MNRGRRENASTGFKSASNLKLGPLRRSQMAVADDPYGLPFQEAIDFLKQKVAVPTKSWSEVWDAAHSKMFMVAGAQTEALVGDFQDAIARALEEGTTLETFRKDFDRIVKAHGWQYKGERGWRSRIIFETNLNTAYSAGRYAKLTAPETLQAYPGWRYNHSGNKHPRLEHKAWDQQVWPANDPVWQTIWPPNGFGCGCFVTPVRASAVAAKGYDAVPDLDQLGTDQPRGIDPSFAYNPGHAWLAQTAPGPQAVSASEHQVARFVAAARRGKWPDGSWSPVAVAKGEHAAKLGVRANTEIRLSASTIRSHGHHDTINDAAYAILPRWLLKAGEVVKDKNGRLAIVGEYEGKAFHAALKVVSKGAHDEIYMVSLRRSSARKIKKLKGE